MTPVKRHGVDHDDAQGADPVGFPRQTSRDPFLSGCQRIPNWRAA
jgi:hypothetical protein